MGNTVTMEDAPSSVSLDRILSLMIRLGAICLFIGILFYAIGRLGDAIFVVQVGIYIFLAGIALITLRIFFWLLEVIVQHGLESRT
jgi:hypothetical protein